MIRYEKVMKQNRQIGLNLFCLTLLRNIGQFLVRRNKPWLVLQNLPAEYFYSDEKSYTLWLDSVLCVDSILCIDQQLYSIPFNVTYVLYNIS